MNKNKYEKLYQEGRNICGEPFPEFLAFFDNYHNSNARVLDLGCGQGRDALFIARQGHHVVGIDLSPTGVAQMIADAQAEGLTVEGVVADMVDVELEGTFDVILLDRVLHMLATDDDRTAVLNKACNHLKTKGVILIADTPKQKDFLEAYFANWQIIRRKKGILIVQK